MRRSRGRGAVGLIRVVVLALGGCSASARFTPPSVTPLPAFGRLLGQPCFKERYIDGLYTSCGRSNRVSIAFLRDYEAITGKARSDPFPYDEAESTPREPPESFRYPPAPLAVVTQARDRRGSLNERTVYVDGPYLWEKLVHEFGDQYSFAVLLIADRRLLTADDEKLLRDALQLDPRTDLYDDQALRRALRAQPSLGPGAFGSVPEARK